MSSVRSPAQATREPAPRGFWSVPLDELLAAMASSVAGLPPDEAARRLARDGPNMVEVAHGHRGLRLLLAQFTSPIVLILVAATVLSMALGDLADGLIILVIIAASGALGFGRSAPPGRPWTRSWPRSGSKPRSAAAAGSCRYPWRTSWSATCWCSTPATWCRPTAGSPGRRSC